MKRVVGVAFIKDNKILIVKSKRSAKTKSYTLIGGGVKKGEQFIHAAMREIKEEIHNGFSVKKEDLNPILCFKEKAASCFWLNIEMTIFICTKEIDVPLIPNKEILDYHWYSIEETKYNVSSSIKKYLIPYAIEKKIIIKYE